MRMTKHVPNKIRRAWVKPIRVFCFHQVSDVFEPDTMWKCDWTQTEAFKQNILALKKKYTFVSLKEAYHHIANDKIRLKQYAVLTADDGWASLKNILPWLQEQRVPVSLFLNPGYFDGRHFREKESERYLLEEDIDEIASGFSNVTFGMHGWEHALATGKSESEFRDEVKRSMDCLQVYPNFVPFFAYTWGRHNEMNDRVLSEVGIVPVMIDGEKNWNNADSVHRELLDGQSLE